MIDVTDDGDGRFTVTVTEGGSSTTHQVTLDDSYYRKLTGERMTRVDLIRHSFEFLLARETKESILRSFDLPVIAHYFPEYERTIAG
jgi:hypothetical protein